MPRLIRVFAGRTHHLVGFVMLWINCSVSEAFFSSYTAKGWRDCTDEHISSPESLLLAYMIHAILHAQTIDFLQLVVEHCDSPIKSIEVQLVRVETCGCAEGYAKDGKSFYNRL